MAYYYGTGNEDASLGAQHISADLRNYEAARTGFFSLIVDDLDGIVKSTFKGNVSEAAAQDKIANAQDIIRLNVTQCDIPHFSVEELQFRRGNEVVKFAGVPTFDAGSFQVDDIVGDVGTSTKYDTKSVLMAWQALTYDVHSGKGGRMANYKKNCTLVEYTQDYQKIREWTLYGVFPTKISEDPFNKESDGARKITCEFVYDRGEMIMDQTESLQLTTL